MSTTCMMMISIPHICYTCRGNKKFNLIMTKRFAVLFAVIMCIIKAIHLCYHSQFTTVVKGKKKMKNDLHCEQTGCVFHFLVYSASLDVNNQGFVKQ